MKEINLIIESHGDKQSMDEFNVIPWVNAHKVVMGYSEDWNGGGDGSGSGSGTGNIFGYWFASGNNMQKIIFNL